MSPHALAADVEERLSRIETRLQRAAEGDSPLVTEAARHVIAAGGKRFRPVLVILAAMLGEPRAEDDLEKAACVVELTHVGSLYHDDVMDEAEMRRGAPSANARWQNSVAILVGDFLFSRASSMVADLGTEFVRLQATTFARLVHGQISETVGPTDGQDPLQHYLRVVSDKTGSLIATSAVFGGMVSGLGPRELTALREFGEQVGAVFQLSDDIIDVTSDHTGKAPGTDLREGVPTLPTLLVRRSDDPADAELRALIDSDLSQPDRLDTVLRLLRTHPVIDRCRAEVQRRVALAHDSLRTLPAGPARDALADLCDELVHRSA